MKAQTKLATLLTALLFSHFAATAQAADAGNIERASGTVTVASANGQPRAAGANTKIQSGDTLTTDAKSEALVKMADNSVVALRPNTTFQFTNFKFEEKPTDSTLSTLIRGTARMISGLIGKASPSNVSVKASTATIGIRGTDFEVAVIEQDTSDGRAGVYNYVHDGGTRVQVAQANADVNKDKTAFAPANLRPGESAIQILDTRPIFLQSGGVFDGIMQSAANLPMNVIQQIPSFR